MQTLKIQNCLVGGYTKAREDRHEHLEARSWLAVVTFTFASIFKQWFSLDMPLLPADVSLEVQSGFVCEGGSSTLLV